MTYDIITYKILDSVIIYIYNDNPIFYYDWSTNIF